MSGGEFVEQVGDAGLPSDDGAGWFAGRILFEFVAGGEIGLGCDVEGFVGCGREHRPAVAELDVDGIVGSGGGELGLRGESILFELRDVPSSCDD